jgi:hypothetical protein
MFTIFWIASALLLGQANSENVTVYDFSDLAIYDAFNDSFLTMFQADKTYTGTIKMLLHFSTSSLFWSFLGILLIAEIHIYH